MKLAANWIWSDDSDGRGYNLCSVFRRDFRLESLPESAVLRITADSAYRLRVNGQWLSDGPCRAWPEHYRYDRIDLGGVLRCGVNRIEAEVRYFGCGTFHQLPQRAGFLAQLDCGDLRIITDESWSAAPLGQWVENTVKSSCQQSPLEIFDATKPDAPWRPASIVAPAEEGPWRDLQERDCPPLTRREFPVRRVTMCSRVAPQLTTVSIRGQQLMFPGENNVESASIFGVILALTAVSPVTQMVRIASCDVRLAVNGRVPVNGEAEFRAGENLVVAVPAGPGGHCQAYELGFPADAGLRIGNPWDDAPRAGCVPLTDCAKIERSTPSEWANPEWRRRRERLEEHCVRALAVKTAAEFRAAFPEGRPLTESESADDAVSLSFEFRHAEPAHPGDVEDPDHLIFSDDRCTTVHPVEGRDIELCCDLGEQNIGYWNFALFAPAGTIVDLAAVEYITPDGRIQHTSPQYRNAMRYICREGYNRFTSFRRRGGRYLFLTLRNFRSPVRIQFLRLVESTYPAVPYGEFASSDDLLTRIYGISQRTLKLCMEDTFTDCPLYEQTLWVGDARSESLFAMSSFGACDLVRRCIRLAGQSLERFPLVADQVPSGWSSVIPVWSFMWGLSAADYYEETGDVGFLREIWPMVRRNLDNADRQVDKKTGLFVSYDWNLFDWCRTKMERPILLYNSFFLIGALDAGIRVAEALGETEAAEEFRSRRAALADALDRVWDSRRLAWPDSVDPEGAPCEDASVHTSMLAILFDAVSPERLPGARANTVSPRSELIEAASPFASLYYYQALEKLHLEERVIERIRGDYRPMLDAGSTTVWETYPGALNFTGEFPTRSHCHAWSAAPLYFLPRLVLGIRNAAPGGTKFVISPHPGSLDWARGARPTVRGRIEVEWRKEGGTLHVAASAPEGVELVFERNDALNDFDIFFNGERV